MALLPKNVGELRRYLETFSDEMPIYVAEDRDKNPDAIPEPFVVVHETDPEPFLVFSATRYISDNVVSIYDHMDPNASWNLPK